MPSSSSLSSYSTPALLTAGGTAALPVTEALFRTSPWLFQAYQAALASTHDRFSSQSVDDTPAAGRPSTNDARVRARTAWSRASAQNNFAPLNNRPNISRALSTPPMPHIITEYTTTLTPQEYYMFLERCWISLEGEATSTPRQGMSPPAAAAGQIPPPITAYSFDLLDLGDSPPQIYVTPANENASVDGEISATDEIPVDQSTLNQLVDLIDELLAEDGTTNISDRFMNAALLQNYESELEDSDKENQSVLGDSDKENSAPPRFLTSYDSDEQNGELQGSSELEGSDKENVRPLSPLPPFARVHSSSDNAEAPLNNSDQENQSPLDESADDDSDKENREPHPFGVLSTLFYDPSAEFGQDHVHSSPEAFDENESELEDSDKENILVHFTPSTTQNHHGPSDNALMLTFEDGDSEDAVSGGENNMWSRDEEVPFASMFDHDTGYDTDLSDFSENESDDNGSDDSDSEHSNAERSPYSPVSADVGVVDDSRSESDDAAHDAHNTDIQSVNEKNPSHQERSDNSDNSDCGDSGLSDNYDYRLTEEQATASDIAAGRAIPVASQRRLIDSDGPRHYMMLRPIARLPRRFTIKCAQFQSEHRVGGDTSEAGSKDGPAGYYSLESTSRSASSEGDELEQYSLATGARADPAHQNNTFENKDEEDEDWTRERRLVFPTSYERTRMHD